MLTVTARRSWFGNVMMTWTVEAQFVICTVTPHAVIEQNCAIVPQLMQSFSDWFMNDTSRFMRWWERLIKSAVWVSEQSKSAQSVEASRARTSALRLRESSSHAAPFSSDCFLRSSTLRAAHENCKSSPVVMCDRADEICCCTVECMCAAMSGKSQLRIVFARVRLIL